MEKVMVQMALFSKIHRFFEASAAFLYSLFCINTQPARNDPLTRTSSDEASPDACS